MTALLKNWQDYPPGQQKRQLYMASREWAVLRERVRARSGGTCERCRHNAAAQVHHQTYERLYRESLEDLVHLCAPCHEFLSAKRERDPMLDRPVVLFGRTIKTVYLAGKISGDNWRDEIIPGWSYKTDGWGNGSCRGCDMQEDWDVREKMIPLPDGRALAYCGPYWADIMSGHGTGNIAHTYEDSDWYIDEDEFDENSTPAPYTLGKHDGQTRSDVAQNVFTSIERADMVFAWINSLDCYGTLVEIGLARSLGRLTVAVAHTAIDYSELWLALHMAHVRCAYPTPEMAWRYLFKNHEGRR